MNSIKRVLPVAQLLLILPAALFMVALLLRAAGPQQVEPAHTAQQIVLWYSGRMWTLWLLLTVLPLVVLGIGCVVLLDAWAHGNRTRPLLNAIRADRATMFVTGLTVTTGAILLIVAAHVLMN